MRDFRLPLQSRWELRFSGILCNVALISQNSADLIQFIILSICSLMDALLQAETCSWLFLTIQSCENCALLGCYAASSDNFLATFRYNLSVPSPGVKNHAFLTPEDGTDRLSLKRHYSLCNNPERCSSHLLRGGSLKSCTVQRCVRLQYIGLVFSIQQEHGYVSPKRQEPFTQRRSVTTQKTWVPCNTAVTASKLPHCKQLRCKHLARDRVQC